MKRRGIVRKNKYTQTEPTVIVTAKLLPNLQHSGSLPRALGRKTTLWGGREAEPRLGCKFKAPPPQGIQSPARSSIGGRIKRKNAGVKGEYL